jgi:hypothetical protein
MSRTRNLPGPRRPFGNGATAGETAPFDKTRSRAKEPARPAVSVNP